MMSTSCQTSSINRSWLIAPGWVVGTSAVAVGSGAASVGAAVGYASGVVAAVEPVAGSMAIAGTVGSGFAPQAAGPVSRAKRMTSLRILGLIAFSFPTSSDDSARRMR